MDDVVPDDLERWEWLEPVGVALDASAVRLGEGRSSKGEDRQNATEHSGFSLRSGRGDVQPIGPVSSV